ncbi:MAG TPA: response regulator [Burkholderiales bacterium]|nr:response regulator [Burkholderiales bacterium]
MQIKKKRILVVEDDAGFRNLLSVQLSVAGYALELAENGAEGAKALRHKPPDLILSDVHMPLLTGLELLSLAKADEKTSSIPVILLSGQSDADTVAMAMQLGAADFLTKPVSAEKLLKSIRACLEVADKKTGA